MVEGEQESRAQALEYAIVVSRLLDSRFFPVAIQAVETRNEELFEEVCEKADIPKDMRKCLKKVIFVSPMSTEPTW